MCQAGAMADIYEANRNICKYVHSTSRGHEAIQLATAFNLLPCDFVSPYYRDESLLLGLGFTPYELMLQLLAKKNDIFSGGREYYSHPSYKSSDKPTIIHQSSATGMQAIPATGAAMGFWYHEQMGTAPFGAVPAEKKVDLSNPYPYPLPEGGERVPGLVVCSLGDAAVTEMLRKRDEG